MWEIRFEGGPISGIRMQQPPFQVTSSHSRIAHLGIADSAHFPLSFVEAVHPLRVWSRDKGYLKKRYMTVEKLERLGLGDIWWLPEFP